MIIQVARQPIFTRNLKVYGYELLYRANKENNFFEGDQTSGDEASSKVIWDSFLGIGIDKLTGGKRAFINFTANLLDQEIATLFPRNTLVIELLENITIDKSIVEKCKALKNKGYSIALDDFIFSTQYVPLLNLVDIIKIDFLELSHDEIRSYIKHFRRPGLTFLAEKVETRKDFEIAHKMGFKLFQGYFFSKPAILSEKDVRPHVINCLHLLQEVNRPEIRFEPAARIIMQDVALSYKLLRLANSAFFSFPQKIKTVHHALVALGGTEVRKWVSLIGMLGISEGGPDELLTLSLIRAQFCKQLASLSNQIIDEESLFMMGLFSTLEALTNLHFDELFEDIHIDENVKKALIDNTGPYTIYFRLILAYEKGEWNVVNALSRILDIDQEDLFNAYIIAVEWSQEVFKV